MTQELPKTYEPTIAEKKWYSTWEKGGYFKPKKGKKDEGYCIIMPPPNVTGRLHAGHALDITTQDALIRYKRMKGYETLFLPGMDHAGIATQNVVEKMLMETEKKTRHDYGREAFLKKTWEWKDEYGGIIAEQQRVMGASPDWDYSMFTMDPEANEAVRKVFVSLYNEGLIYQSDYIINWDPVLQSAISDAEVEHKEVKGAFYHILYKIKGSDETLEIATTRPETLLADTALCVHPDDERFQKFIGKTAIVPLCGREIPILADDYVTMDKGTGCLKVTPGHDFNDFEIGRRHKLEIITMLNKDGTLNDVGMEFKGFAPPKARKLIVEKLEELGQLKEIKKHVHQVGHGERSGAIIEPLVSKQWFVNVTDMSKVAVEAVENDDTTFWPKQWENTYFSWLREPKDWCVSRQLWWGHQIPVFYCNDCNHQWASESDETSCTKCKSKNVHQDPDVLDTWFSSALWPFSTLGWPNEQRMKEKNFETFFPTACLVTGFDIIFFWVARMMMLTHKTLNIRPFKHVYIHAIVRDKFGRKMSKSLGNGIDPLETVADYGADAFRFTLAAGSGYNRTLNLDPERINGYKAFVNKLWNAFRFTHPFLQDASELPKDLSQLDHHERWILAELNTVAAQMNQGLDEYRFDEACHSIYHFVYEKFCSWFIELSKPILYGDDQKQKSQRAAVLRFAFREIVTLLHPITPFITEELWSHLKNDGDDLLIVRDYPEFRESLQFTTDQEQMNKFVEIVSSTRALRQSVGIKPKEEAPVEIFSDDQQLMDYLSSQIDGLKDMTKATYVKIQSKDLDRPAKSAVSALTHCEIFLPLEGLIDIDDQLERLNKDMTKTEGELAKLTKKLTNPQFIDNAKPEIVEKVKAEASELEEKISSIKRSLANFK
tara:strand:- start:8537 stop:11194 length:2658 start_codon:yes stop_codon:yes gene_type:complete